MAATAEEKRFAAKVVRRLRREYPDAGCSLDYNTPLELLVATMLSAQCTDERVNLVTKGLFTKYRSAADYAAATQAEIEREIKSTGFFRNKAKNIRACCQALLERYDGEIPQELSKLTELSGIGRKTANVVLGNAFGICSGVVVDTHVGRISRRLGLSEHKDAEKVKATLRPKSPRRNGST